MNYIILLTLIFVGCLRGPVIEDPQITRLNELTKNKKLVIVTVNSPTTFYEDNEGVISGLEYDLVSAFARDQGLIPEFIVAESIREVIEMIRNHQAHFAASGLTITDERKKYLDFSSPYQETREWVICHKEVRVKSMRDLENKKIKILSGSSYEDKIYAQRIGPLMKPENFTKTMTTDEILQKIWEREVDCTILDSHVFSVYQRYMPELKRKIELEGKSNLAWAMAPGQDYIKSLLNDWLDKKIAEGMVRSYLDKYYSYREDFDYYDTKVFLKRIQTRLMQFRPVFKEAADKYDLDWRLLASIAYQESHWRPNAKSPTGVRGMMMLTNAAAKDLKVKDRLNPKESIFGGALHLKRKLARVPTFIPPEDRLWMAIAAYNVGHYHLRDARALAIWKDKNPNIWSDVKEVLPLLSKKKYYHRLPYGRARGLEPVVYVKRIKGYYDLMIQQFPESHRAPSAQQKKK